MSNVIESKSPAIIASPYRMSAAEVMGLLQSDAANGLSKVEAARRLETYGPNQLEYAVCKNRMLSVESYVSAWVYQRTELDIGNLPLLGRSLHEKTGLVFVFNGCGVASCSVYRDWSGWHEGNVWQQGTCLP
jgi:hypothetical protein